MGQFLLWPTSTQDLPQSFTCQSGHFRKSWIPVGVGAGGSGWCCALCTSAGTYRACIPYMWYKYVYLSRLASLAQRLVPVSIRVPFEWLMMKGCVKGSGRRSGGGVRGGGGGGLQYSVAQKRKMPFAL